MRKFLHIALVALLALLALPVAAQDYYNVQVMVMNSADGD